MARAIAPTGRSFRTVRSMVALLCVGAALVGCGDDGDAGGQRGPIPPGAEPTSGERSGGDGTEVRATKVAQLPIMLTSFGATEDGAELLVGDRQGVVRRLVRTETDGYVVPTLDPVPVLDLASEVSLLGERGAFDLVLVGGDRWLIVNYTALDGTITVERFPYRSGEPIDRSEGVAILELPHPYAWHHGGGLALDRDGDLFVAIGDMEFRQFDPPGPQDPDLLLGGVLRIPAAVVVGSVDGWRASPEEMVARGLRNPWRISLDRELGDLWIGEVGLQDREEINLIRRVELGDQTNFGWPYLEGSRPNQGPVPDGLELVGPVLEREQEPGVCGMVGGFVYRGSQLAGLVGRFVYGDLCSPEVRAFDVDDDGEASNDRVITTFDETPISFGEGHEGELYVLGSAGGLYRLDPATWRAPANEQVPVGPPQTTTTIPRSTQDCDRVVGAAEPLSRIGGLSPEELEAVVVEATDQMEIVVPTLPLDLMEDAMVVQRVLLDLRAELEALDWRPDVEAVAAIRAEAFSGTGRFEGFPEAMARVVDSECG